MSTINAANYGDGSSSVPASAVLKGTAKVWVRYDQTGPTVNASYNVSSVDDDGAGDFGVNFTNAFAATSFSQVHGGGDGVSVGVDARTTGAAEHVSRNLNNTQGDYADNGCAFYGDLA